jgi:hypothetical protein
VLRQLNLSPEENISFSEENGESVKAKPPWDLVPAGHKIGRPVPLFEELVRLSFRIFLFVAHKFYTHNVNSLQKDEKVSEYREKYAGSQAERNSKAVADAEATKIANQTQSIALSGKLLDNILFKFCRSLEHYAELSFLLHILEQKEKLMLVNLCYGNNYLETKHFLSWQVCFQAPCSLGLKPGCSLIFNVSKSELLI